jgi:hypothetical protein
VTLPKTGMVTPGTFSPLGVKAVYSEVKNDGDAICRADIP